MSFLAAEHYRFMQRVDLSSDTAYREKREDFGVTST